MELEETTRLKIEELDRKSREIFDPNNPQTSIDLLIEAYQLIPEPRTSYYCSTNLLKYITICYFRFGYIDESEKWLPEFLESDSKLMGYGESEYLAGKIALKRNDQEKAISYFIEANQKSGGRVFQKSGEEKEYFEFFKTHAKGQMRPKTLSALLKAAKKEVDTKNYAYALDLLYDALNLDLTKTETHFHKGLCHFELGELDHAADSFTRAYMLDGENMFRKYDPKYFDFLKTRIEIGS